MEDSDGDELSDTSEYLAVIVTPSDPVNMKKAFDMLIDGVIARAENRVIDWGTTQFDAKRAISDITGQELHYFQIRVRAISLVVDE